MGEPGKLGVVVVCKRWRDARLKLMLEKVTITRKKGLMKDLAEAMVDELRRVGRGKFALRLYEFCEGSAWSYIEQGRLSSIIS